MHFSHDKHQYFFEKYLRKEMSGEELAAFEKRLSENTRFKADLDYYIRNRKEIVAEELAEYDKPELLHPKPQKWGWVYAVISLFCIVLIVDYFLSSRYSPAGSEKRSEPLIERINSFIRHPGKQTNTQPVQGGEATENQDMVPDSGLVQDESDTVSQMQQQLDQQFLPALIGNGVSIHGDFFVFDSLFRVLEQPQVVERKNQLRLTGDSLQADSAITLEVLKNYYRTFTSNSKQILVEYWSSPIHFHGYLFTGKKLVLYDVDPTEPVYISCQENNTNFHLYLKGFEYHLFSDSQLHKLSEE